MHVAVADVGIGGNRVVGPDNYTPQQPEGINDLSKSGRASAAEVIAGMRQGVARIRERMPGVRVIGATVTTALGSSNLNHGSAEQDTQRKILHDIIRNDGVADFDRASLDLAAGGMRAEFVPERAPVAVTVTSCTRTARDTRRWPPPSTWRYGLYQVRRTKRQVRRLFASGQRPAVIGCALLSRADDAKHGGYYA
jgi:hypothetical protein